MTEISIDKLYVCNLTEMTVFYRSFSHLHTLTFVLTFTAGKQLGILVTTLV